MPPMWLNPFSLEGKRRRRYKAAPEGPLKEYYRREFPGQDQDWRTVEFLAVDLETTGLDPRRHEILSFGHVVMRHAMMQMGSCDHYLVRPKGPLQGESVVVHGITDDQSTQGLPMEEALQRFLQALAGRVMIAHHASIELGFIDRACRDCFGYGIMMPISDTFILEQRKFQRAGRHPKQGELRLAAVRERYGLPRYRAHNALIDAIAAGELLQAQAAYRAIDGNINLGELLTGV